MVRLSDVARLAGVSASTASKVLTGGSEAARISAQCTELVRDAARKLNYTPNYHARSLLRGRSQTLGMILHGNEHDIGGGFWARTIGGIADATRALGYDFLVIGPTAQMNELEHGLKYLKEGRIDALVAPGFLGSVRVAVALHDLDLPIVLAEFYRPTRLPVVQLDPAPGIRAAVRHLLELGHRDLLWIGFITRTGNEVAPERRAAFEQAAREAGVRARVEFFRWTFDEPDGHAPNMIRRSREMYAELMRRVSGHTAIIAYNELMGLGIYAALNDAGLRVPHDMSLIGFDNIHAELAVPPMTTVSLLLGEIGKRAAELAVEMAAGKRKPAALRNHLEKLPAQLIVRESTAPPRRS